MAYFNNKRIMLACAYEEPAAGTTLKNLLDTTRSAIFLFYKYTGTNVDNLIAYNDTENVLSMESMFSNCANLISLPNLNTSNVINMINTFNKCLSLTSFSNSLMDTSNVGQMVSMFANCTNLVTVDCDTSNVLSMSSMFERCTSLKSVTFTDVSNCGNFASMFKYCSMLEEIHMNGVSYDLDISASTRFSESALVDVLNDLAIVTSYRRLTMGATNLAKLTQAEKDIALNKGWTLA